MESGTHPRIPGEGERPWQEQSSRSEPGARRAWSIAAVLAIAVFGAGAGVAVAGCGSDDNNSSGDVNSAIDSIQSQASSVQSQISSVSTNVQSQAQSISTQVRERQEPGPDADPVERRQPPATEPPEVSCMDRSTSADAALDRSPCPRAAGLKRRDGSLQTGVGVPRSQQARRSSSSSRRRPERRPLGSRAGRVGRSRARPRRRAGARRGGDASSQGPARGHSMKTASG